MSKPETIAIIDDDAQVRKSMGMLFRRTDFDVHLFDSAKQFLDSFDPSNADCILADLIMPEMNGLDLQHALQVQQCGTPFILMTGNTDDPLAKSTGGQTVAMIEKPFRFDELLSLIRSSIGKAAEAGHLESPANA